VELAVHRLHPIGCIRDYGRWCGGPAVAFVPAALWHSKPFFASKALHFLVIDCPAFCGRCDARAETPSRLVLGVVAQPGPQRRIRIVGVQFRISQKPLERGVFTLEVVEPLDVLPGPNGSPPTARRTESTCGESPLRRSSPRPGLVTRQPRRQQSGGPTVRSSRRSNRSITAGGRFVELGMNSRYRGVNTRCPGVNSLVGSGFIRA
jgi:hypothetical protein